MKASIALQILPLSDNASRLTVIEKVIAFLQSQPVKQQVLLKENQRIFDRNYVPFIHNLQQSLRLLKLGSEPVKLSGRVCGCR